MTFSDQIAQSSAHRKSRESIAGAVLKDQSLLPELMAFAFDHQDKNHHKAWWAAELVFEKNPGWIAPHLDSFCNIVNQLTQDGAVRLGAKICWFLVLHDHQHRMFLSENQSKIIVDACFDWLIATAKVAAKAYAMRALFELGKKDGFAWIHRDLAELLEAGYGSHSAAYRAASRELLQKMARLKTTDK